jgi:transcriptional regulator with XRE-family HTH domain
MTTVRETDRGWVPSAESFGARLALVRNHLGLNVKAAAERAGMDHSSWGTWERGRQPRDLLEKARKISDALGCDYLWLLTGTPPTDGDTVRCSRWYPSATRVGVTRDALAVHALVPAA